MPSLSMYKLSPPTDAAEFEKMLVDYAESVYRVQASLYGRKGQAQHGIDVIVETNPRTCIQCKDYHSTPVTTNKIDSWINDAENSKIGFLHFIIAVVGSRDARLQDHVYSVSDSRKSEGKFTVSIIFWDDIEHVIKTDPNLLRIYYPEFYIANDRMLGAYYLKQQETAAIRRASDSKQSEQTQTPILITSEAALRKQCLELVVKYQIQSFLRVDPFSGFPFDLVADVDCFEIDMQVLLDKSISMVNWSSLYEYVRLLKDAIDRFNAFLSVNCQFDSNSTQVRIIPAHVDRNGIAIEVEELRRAAQSKLDEISNWE